MWGNAALSQEACQPTSLRVATWSLGWLKQSTLSVPDGKPLEVLTPDDGLSRSKTFLFQYLPLRVVCHTWNPTSKDGCGLFPKRLLQMISRESLLNEEREKKRQVKVERRPSPRPFLLRRIPLLWIPAVPPAFQWKFFPSLFFLFCFCSFLSFLSRSSSFHAPLYIECDGGKSVTFYLLGHQPMKRHTWIWWRVLPGTRSSGLCEACSNWAGLWGRAGLCVLADQNRTHRYLVK